MKPFNYANFLLMEICNRKKLSFFIFGKPFAFNTTSTLKIRVYEMEVPFVGTNGSALVPMLQ
jgi:hypothetical protein